MEELRRLVPDIDNLTSEEIQERIRLISTETRFLKSELCGVNNEILSKSNQVNENNSKINLNKNLPFLVGNLIETFDDGSAVVVTSTRQSWYLSAAGLVSPGEVKPGDSVALHKETNIIFETIPPAYDSKVLSMELKIKPEETYNDIGGLEKQIEELNEAIVFPLVYPEKFKKMNITPPKGVLMYGPPGTGKTLMARACAAKSNASFLKLSGSQLVQMYIGDGARLVRDIFEMAKAKKPSIIFIDEIDAIGVKRAASDKVGDREVQRTMLELLNELDGFTPNSDVKIIAATNRVDMLDPALMRSGRFDRKIEFPLPDVEGRKRIFEIHSRTMEVEDEVDFMEIARSTEGFNGAQCKAVCTEAGMAALRNTKTTIGSSDFIEGVCEVSSRKKSKINYFT